MYIHVHTKHKKTKTSSTHKITATVAITMKDCAPVFLKTAYIRLTNFTHSVMNKEKREYRRHFFQGDASWHYVPLAGGSSVFSNCGFLGVVRGTFSSGTVLSGTSGSLKILVNFHFCEY